MGERFQLDLTGLYINYLLIGQANLGPKVLGVFKGGIITEFFEVFFIHDFALCFNIIC